MAARRTDDDRPDAWPAPAAVNVVTRVPAPAPPRRDMHHHPPPAAPPAASEGPSSAGWTLMVAGQRSGKTSFLRLLLDTSDVAPSASHDQVAAVAKFVQGCSSHTTHLRQAAVDVLVPDMDDHTRRLVTLAVIDTPSLDFSDEGALERQTQDILQFVDAKFAESCDDDYKARTGDHHVHLCLYFLDPDVIVPPQVPSAPPPMVPRARTSSHTDGEPFILEAPVTTNPLLYTPVVPAAEIETIRRLSARVNVLPVIARADTLTNDRLAAVKMAVRNDLARAGIGFGIFDQSEEDVSPLMSRPAYSNGNGHASRISPPSPPRVPYALISPDLYAHSDGAAQVPLSRHELIEQYTPSHNRPSNLVLGKYTRTYRWGSLDVLDRKHCDFLYLRAAIFHHMETLHTYTKGYLFKRYKTEVPAHRMQAPVHHPVSQHSRRLPPLSEVSRSLPALEAPHPAAAVDRHSSLGTPLTLRADPRVAGSGILGPEVAVHPPTDKAPYPDPSLYKQRAKKIPVACNFCRSRKLKCDGGRPACSQCLKRGNTCDYIHNVKRRGPGRPPNQFGDSGSEAESSIGRSPYDTPSRSPEVQMHPPRNGSTVDMLLSAESAHPAAMSVYGPPEDSLSVHRHRTDGRPRSNTLGGSSTSSGHAEPPFNERHLPQMPFSSPPSPVQRDNGSYSANRSGMDPPPTAKKRGSVFVRGHRQSHGSKVVACNFCRARKTKCDSVHPTCASCARRQLPCSYINGASGRSAGSSESRAKEESNPSSPSPSPPPSADRVSLNRISSADRYPHEDEYTDGSDIGPLKKMRLEGMNDSPIAVATLLKT
ncbi:hypothetical protein PUNSTDRAFT_131205 [Punctularia strigosozonata HHB-11173 SS5]|uniref:uncharacterized protein n=1 Tax=Punctularia strigosozonata (strain HHB-11173) TaxID=741275 RepID=UPI0004417410|nr:uncharacterized protein PUNSTDRAFT_131205 [Punctularia strigosozonata HHB-11173 SS5]EIN12975.1 hypothetical protein PUNSTDRAFT_131205 [Punctularia strigosozonata HHB-11173 SS5]